MNQHFEKVSRRGFLVLGGLTAAFAPLRRLVGTSVGESSAGAALATVTSGALTGSGVAAGAQRSAGVAEILNHPLAQDSPTVTYAIPGTRPATSTTLAKSVTVSCGVHLADHPQNSTIWLGFATSTPAAVGTRPTSGITWVSQPVGAYGLFKYELAGLTPNQQYIAGLSPSKTVGDWIGDPIAFHTLADTVITEQTTITWALGSCQYYWGDNPKDPITQERLQYAWQDLLSNPVNLLLDVGDFHYQGGSSGDYGDAAIWPTWATMYWVQLQELATMRAARALMIEEQVSDDHDFSFNNGESALPPPSGQDDKQGKHRQTQMEASQHVFAIPDTADSQGRGLYYSYMVTLHVRVIVVDGESLDRSWGAYPDASIKSYLGGVQTQWLKDTLSTTIVPLNLIVSSKAWIASAVYDAPDDEDTDKIWAYPAWRNDFASWLTTWNSTHESRKISLVWMAGDRHFVAYDDGSHNLWGGFKTVIGSGWCEKALGRRVGEAYSQWYPPAFSATPSPDPVFQYARGSIVDDPKQQTVTLNVTLRARVSHQTVLSDYASTSWTWSY